MSKLLKLVFSISIILFSFKSFCQSDSANHKKHQYWLFASAGISIIDKLNMQIYDYGNKTNLWISGKPSPIYAFGFIHQINNFNIGVSGSYLQSRYNHNSKVGISYYTGTQGSVNVNKTFNFVNEVKLSVYQLAFNIGYSKLFKSKHCLSFIGGIHSNLYQQYTIKNYYAKEQLGDDTTQYELSHNIKSKGRTYYGSPSFSLKMSYEYLVAKQLKIGLAITSQYFLPLIFQESDRDDDYIFKYYNNHYFDIYTLKQQFIIYPSLNIMFRLN